MWMISWAFFAYAGWRRVQMRRRFALPGDDVRDYTAWLLCPLCALCQEGRTLLHNRVDNGVWHGPLPMGAPPVQAFGGGALFDHTPQPQFAAQQPQYATLPPGVYPPPPGPWSGAPMQQQSVASVPLPPPPPPPPRRATLPPALAQPAAGMYVPPSAADVDGAAK